MDILRSIGEYTNGFYSLLWKTFTGKEEETSVDDALMGAPSIPRLIFTAAIIFFAWRLVVSIVKLFKK